MGSGKSEVSEDVGVAACGPETMRSRGQMAGVLHVAASSFQFEGQRTGDLLIGIPSVCQGSAGEDEDEDEEDLLLCEDAAVCMDIRGDGQLAPPGSWPGSLRNRLGSKT